MTSIARGARVELLLSSPEQHYGWEALDVILNLAATPEPQSVLSLSFGGLEKAHRGEDSAESTASTLAGNGTTLESLVPGGAEDVAEDQQRASYVRQSNSWDTHERVDTEIAKLGLRGVTVVAASGDNGPFSHGVPNPYLAWGATDVPCAFRPSFPASMPHVTTVGGTTGGKDPFEPERAAAVELGSKISSGGGFSSIFPMPEWQKAAVERYLKQYSYDLPPESFFNASNRGYPDVALAADDIALIFASFPEEEDDDSESSSSATSPPPPSPAIDRAEEAADRAARASDALRGVGETPQTDLNLDAYLGRRFDKASADALGRRARHYLTESSGTSFSAPLFAGMVALINDERLAQNKSTLGFINPALYSLHRTDADVFRDVKEGSSKCPNPAMTGAMVGCCKHGFRTGKGWDPMTGLGSVDFARLRDELLKLP